MLFCDCCCFWYEHSLLVEEEVSPTVNLGGITTKADVEQQTAANARRTVSCVGSIIILLFGIQAFDAILLFNLAPMLFSLKAIC